MKYVDASALLRLLFAESGPTLNVTPGDVLVSSVVLAVEAHRAVERERLVGRIDDEHTARKKKQLIDLLRGFDLIAVDERVIARASLPFGVHVRALDAIHVATAEVIGSVVPHEAIEFWTHDDRQGNAALSRGLSVRGLS